MNKTMTFELDEVLVERAEATARRRGITLNQLVSQQLERSVSNQEYSELRRKVLQNQPVSPRAPKRATRG